MNEMQLPLIPLSDGGMSKLELAFWQFHQDNPKVYQTLVTLAEEWRSNRGVNSVLGIGMLWERMRWQMFLATRGDDFKLNNNHRAFYARLIMIREPTLKGIFELRQQRAPSTIGATNG